MKSRFLLNVAGLLLACGIGGCTAYVTPGRGVDLSQIAPDALTPQAPGAPRIDGRLSETFNAKPTAQLPASIAIARIQADGYHSYTCESWGHGKFCVVTTRDIEDPKLFEQWQSMPSVAGLVPLNRLLLPEELNSDMDLRAAAAKLHADMLLIYTLDTNFYTQDQAVPLSIITLGLAPDNSTRVVTTASAVLLDTRTGYVYGAAEATARDDGATTSWSTESAIENARQRTERGAFKDLSGQVESMWARVAKDYGRPQ